jgi:hypothetical protein
LLAKKAEGLTRTVAIYAASLERFFAWCELKTIVSVESLTAEDAGRWKLRASVEETLKALKLEEFA